MAAGIAWATLVVVLPAPPALVPVSVGAGVVAVVALAAAIVLGRRAAGAAGTSTTVAVLALVALAAGAAAIVTGSAAGRLEAHRPEALAALRGHVVALEGVAVRGAGEGASSLRLDVDRVASGSETWTGPSVAVLVLSPRLADRVVPGERLRLWASLLDGLDGEGAEEGGPVPFLAAARSAPVVTASASGPWSWAEGPRAAFRAVVEGLPGDGAALLPGLVVGDTSAVGDDLDAAMRASSLTHTLLRRAVCVVR